MKLTLAVFTSLVAATASSSKHLEGRVKDIFNEWMEDFDKEYKTRGELLQRMEIWAENHFFIEEHNNQHPKPSYELGHNQFSDMTVDEFQEMNNLGEHSPGIRMQMKRTPKPAATLSVERRLKDLPDGVNWVEQGAVVPVKNQGACGSCWAFSAIGAIEGAHYLNTGDLVSLSENELIDCDPLDAGCGGGLMDNAFLFDENSTGVCSEADYPYVGHKRWFRGCAIKKGLCSAVKGTEVKTFYDVPNTVVDLKEAIADQPVSVGIEADKQSFQFYKSGVYDDVSCGNQLDHGVIAVGYGSEDDKGYFLVRNSWGATWGDQGYIKMATESKTVNGTCGILGFASRPVLKK